MRFSILLTVLLGVCLNGKAQCLTIGLAAEGQNLSNWTVSSSYNSQNKELYVSGMFAQETLTFVGHSVNALAFDNPLVSDLYLMKLAPDMQVDWLIKTGKSINIPTSSRLCATDDGVLAAFQFVDTVTFASQQFIIEDGGFHENALFMKFGQQGDIEWIYRLTEVGTSQINAIDVGKDGMIYIVGTYTEELNLQGQILTASDPQTTDGEMFIAKFLPDGNLIWLKHLGGGEANDKAYSLSCGSNGIFVAGFFEGNLNIGSSNFTSPVPFQDGFVASVDTAGNVVWSVQLDGSTSIRNEEVIAFKDGCLVSGHFRGSLEISLLEGGSLFISSTTSASDLFAIRLSGNGNPLWLNKFGGVGAERMLRLEPVNDDLFMMSGSSTSSFSVDGLNYTNHASTQGNENGIVLLLDSTGTVRCLSEMPSANASSALVEYIEGDTIVFVGGFVEDLTIQNLSLNIDGTSSVVVNQCLGCNELIWLDTPVGEKSTVQFTIYPNPASQSVRVETTGNSQQLTALTITNMLGHSVLHQKTTANENNIDISGLASGLYTVAATFDNGETARRRLVVQH